MPLEHPFYGNPVWRWLLAVAVALVAYLAFTLSKRILENRAAKLAKRTATEVDDFAVELLERRTKGVFLAVLALAGGSAVVSLPPALERAVRVVVTLTLFLQAGLWLDGGISFWIGRATKRQAAEDPQSLSAFGSISFLARLGLWVLVSLLLLRNLGIDITALIAGLGVGGIAVALAVQNILGDLFASMSIVLDKPFVIGDFVIIGDYLGTVEHIGLKTTRLRSLSGEQIVFSNTDLLNSRVRNYKRMYERRVVFSLGVTYRTPDEKLAAIPPMIREIVESLPDARFDRAHFARYGDFALIFEVVYYVTRPDYNIYMDRQQAINLAIYRRFAKEGIEFAYPTQTIFLSHENHRSGACAQQI